MNFTKLFEQQIISKKISFTDYTSNDYLPISVAPFNKAGNQIPYLQGLQDIVAGYPFHLALSHLDSYCLLFTESGNGKLTYEDSEYHLVPGSLAIIDCREAYQLETIRSPWHFLAWYIKGLPIPYLVRNILEETKHLYIPNEGSTIPSTLKKLNVYSKKDNVSHYTVSKILINILFEILAELETKNAKHVINSTMISQIKHYIDQHYSEFISLESLESEFSMSRYKICHQFTSAYFTSPIQYLSTLRIKKAKILLLETDLKVHEISKTIGI